MIIFTIVGCIAIWIYHSIQKDKKRKIALMAKYHDEGVVESIMAGSFWQGQTAEMVIDSLGAPVDIDQKVLKTKKKEIWKYHHEGANRYGLRIILEDDIVVGWAKK